MLGGKKVLAVLLLSCSAIPLVESVGSSRGEMAQKVSGSCMHTHGSHDTGLVVAAAGGVAQVGVHVPAWKCRRA